MNVSAYLRGKEPKESLEHLKEAMEHSSLAVSLTYLRGLEVSELEEEHLPVM